MKTEEVTDFGEKILILPASILPFLEQKAHPKGPEMNVKKLSRKQTQQPLQHAVNIPKGKKKKDYGINSAPQDDHQF